MFRPIPVYRSERTHVPASGEVLRLIEAWLSAAEASRGKGDFSREASAEREAWRALDLKVLETPLVWHHHGGWRYGMLKSLGGWKLYRFEDKR